ncbi:hypothetical protein H257_16358 [Aphanomyces astaci]|uniref:Uncharacterized protein n=1 Tax=Aphanomyces astaci TaxID=112090 RepID=W4FKU8_APHAT|nr:hypothetical protein H257_16358 [Aphanomyces astaci]ETV67506.1 hypothetical protein H257_16358 [Aphanomyces astaci]|eukprot:XP_009843065.1 hypothetical protein H257_16358 [Aphanomyces astaci]
MKAVKQVGQLVASQGDDAATMDNDGEIPIQLNLPGVTLNFTSEWIMDTRELQEAKAHHADLLERIQTLEQENTYLREKCVRINDESNLDKFKSQLLVEMLAISSLDEEKSKAEYIKEKLKVESLKHDMKALLEKAAHHNIDIKQFATHLKSM